MGCVLHKENRKNAVLSLNKEKDRQNCFLPVFFLNIYNSIIRYLYSCQLLIWISFCPIWQNASIKALASRALVINGML